MSKQNNPKFEAKKAAVLKHQDRKMNPITIVIGVLVLLGAAGIGYYITANASPTSQMQTVTADTGGSSVAYPVSMFQDGKAHHFDYKTGNLNIRYFILKSSDGIIRAAFDACDVCWPAGKGYYQDGDDMVCRNCGRRFASVLVNEVQGGCNPAPLNRIVQGDQLILKADEIIKGRSYFDLKGKV
jgi:uncharacterized membrane protein